jgi:hypothetical protein
VRGRPAAAPGIRRAALLRPAIAVSGPHAKNSHKFSAILFACIALQHATDTQIGFHWSIVHSAKGGPGNTLAHCCEIFRNTASRPVLQVVDPKLTTP